MSKKTTPTLTWLTLLRAFGPVFVWAGLIFIMSSQRSLHGFELDTLDFILKKTAHIIEYAILFFLVHRGLRQTFPHYRFNWLVAIIVCVTYALSDEWHQSFVTGRTASLRDVGFDTLGVSLAFLGIYRYI